MDKVVVCCVVATTTAGDGAHTFGIPILNDGWLFPHHHHHHHQQQQQPCWLLIVSVF